MARKARKARRDGGNDKGDLSVGALVARLEGLLRSAEAKGFPKSGHDFAMWNSQCSRALFQLRMQLRGVSTPRSTAQFLSFRDRIERVNAEVDARRLEPKVRPIAKRAPSGNSAKKARIKMPLRGSWRVIDGVGHRLRGGFLCYCGKQYRKAESTALRPGPMCAECRSLGDITDRRADARVSRPGVGHVVPGGAPGLGKRR